MTSSRFAAAVAEHPFPDYEFDPGTLARAAASLADAGLLVVGEPHGVRETPSVLYALASALGTRAVAFEWSHEEMDEPVQTFLRDSAFDFERLWSLHERAWADFSRDAGGEPDHDLRESVLAAHEAITEAIHDGDPALAHRAAATHLATTQPRVLDHLASPRVSITGGDAALRR